MSNGEGSKVSLHDLQLVQNLIEMSLKLYMNKTEVVNNLFVEAKIEPEFTELVWKELEAENQEFFMEYYKRLVLKDQILRFNQLLEKQYELMHQMSMSHTDASLTDHLSNGIQTHSMHRNSAYEDQQPHIPYMKSENMYPAVPHVYTNGTYSPQQCMPAYTSGHAGRMDLHAYMPLVQNSNAGIMQGFNERDIKTECMYAGNPSIMFGAHNHLLEPHYEFIEATISPFNGGDSCSQSFNGSLLETDMNSFGVDQMTPSFSLSELTTDFSDSTDVVENYSGYPVVVTNTNFLNPHISAEDQEEVRRLETTSEGFSYEGFSSN